ncbi:hypothetical protein GF325_08790 [Candidatus Bathyarchaeota archaeon]|nr:hypothetical protein [Candidatus Bathyarchaeota archaeon]
MMKMTTFTSSSSISRRKFMMAMNSLPPIIIEPDSPTVDNIDHFLAVFYDFMNHELDIDVTRAVLQNLLGKKLDKERMRMLLISIGFLSSSHVLPVLRDLVSDTRDKVDLAEYIVRELLVLTLYLGEVINPEMILTNDERKEEFARKLLKIFKVGIDGETREESSAILETIDSVEIHKLTNELEVKIREEIEKILEAERAAAAAKPSRE